MCDLGWPESFISQCMVTGSGMVFPEFGIWKLEGKGALFFGILSSKDAELNLPVMMEPNREGRVRNNPDNSV